MDDYAVRHGQLPTAEVMDREGHKPRRAGTDRGERREPVSYWHDRVKRRAAHNASVDAIHKINMALQARDTDRIPRLVDQMKSEIDGILGTGTVIADPETIARKVEELGGCGMSSLRDREFEPENHVVHGVVSRGLTALAGDPKCGKSWLAMDTAICVATGQNALGSLPVDRGGVVYFALEDRLQDFKERVEKLEQEFPDDHDMLVLPDCPKLDQGGLELIEQIIVSRQPRLVVIDTLTKVRKKVNDRAPLQQEDHDAVAGLKALADRHDVAVLVVLHTRKSKGKTHVQQVAGSHGLTGALDGIVTLEKSEGLGTGILRVDGRRVPSGSFRLTQNPATMRWRVSGRNVAEELSQEQRRVFHHLGDNPESSPAQVAAALGMNRSTVSNHLKALERSGMAYHNGANTSAIRWSVVRSNIRELYPQGR